MGDAGRARRGGSRQLVRLYGGHATATAGGGATVVWDGDFSINFYGGLVPFTVPDPRLAIAPDGTGTLTADLSGYASTQADPTRRSPLAPVAGVTIATFAGVAIDPSGSVTVTPAWSGVEVTAPAGLPAQVRDEEGWGAWPQAFVDFHARTGLASYWYTSGSVFDEFKRPDAFVVDFAGAAAPPLPQPPRVDPPLTDPPVTVPQPVAPAPRTVVPGSISVPRGARTVGAGRLATLATLVCPSAAPCTVRAPRRVTATIAGKRHTLTVLAPRTVRAGRRAALQVRLTKAAAKRLAGRSATVEAARRRSPPRADRPPAPSRRRSRRRRRRERPEPAGAGRHEASAAERIAQQRRDRAAAGDLLGAHRESTRPPCCSTRRAISSTTP